MGKERHRGGNDMGEETTKEEGTERGGHYMREGTTRRGDKMGEGTTQD